VTEGRRCGERDLWGFEDRELSVDIDGRHSWQPIALANRHVRTAIERVRKTQRELVNI
jgi:hypothetical protein